MGWLPPSVGDDSFVERCKRQAGEGVRQSGTQLKRLADYRWPVKELARVIKRKENAVSQMLFRMESAADRLEVQQVWGALE